MTDEQVERLLEALKSTYAAGGDDMWNILIHMIADQVAELEAARDEAATARFVDEAEDGQLERIGRLVDTPPRSDESDEHYRARLKLQLRKFMGGATVEQVREMSAILLNSNKEAFDVSEDFGTEPARFEIALWMSDLDDSNFTQDDFTELLSEVRASGVRVVARARGTFTYRSEQDFKDGVNNPDRGYNEGTYAGLIQ